MFILLLELFTLLLAALYVLKQYKERKLPPGPIGLPVFGYYFFLGKNPMLKLHELSKTYGNVFGLTIGSQYVIYLDDWAAAKETLNKTAVLERPDIRFVRVPYKLGVIGANGREWFQNRPLTTRAIKEVGIDGLGADDLFQDVTLDWIERIVTENGKPLDVNAFFAQWFVSNLMELVLEERLDYEHRSTKVFTEAVSIITESTYVFAFPNVCPSLGKLMKLLDIKGADMMTESVKELIKYVSDTIDTKIEDLAKAVEKDSFIGQFQKEIESQRKDVISLITVDSLKGNALALINAGGNTGHGALIWTLIAMAENPDHQHRVHEELDSVIGNDGVLKWGEQARVPYTYASLLESMRWKTVIPFITRRNSEALEINGYRVPKNTTFVFNNWAMHNDLRYWKNPEQFIPERFLHENGQKVDSAPESFNPFSFGRRGCLGKQIALKAHFLIFTLLMQKFEVMPKSGAKVEYDTNLGLTYIANNVELRFIPR